MWISLFIAYVIMGGIFLLRIHRLPPQVPLLYSKVWGEEQLVDLWFIFILPSLLTFFILFNTFLYRIFFSENHFVKKILNYVHLFLILGFTLVFVRVILLVS